MERELHRLLKRQLRKDLGEVDMPPQLAGFIQSVNAAYYEFEDERGLMERSIEISSREYNEKNAELKRAEERLKNLVETIPQGILIINSEGKIEFANSVAEKIFGLPRNEMKGMDYNAPLWEVQAVPGHNVIGDGSLLETVMATGQPIHGLEYSITSCSGEKQILYVNAAPFQDSLGEFSGLVTSLEDITLRKQMEDRLRYLGLHDSLTGLYNRAFFAEEMRRVSCGVENPLGIIICDIDGLKLVNDTLGHEQGDKLLLAVAETIRQCFMGENAVVARIGGDEFGILLKLTDRQRLERLCQKLRETIVLHNEKEKGSLLFSVSIGFAFRDEVPVNMADAFKEADNNMYREKLHHEQSTRSAIVQTLVKAMEARDFCTEGHADRMKSLAELLARSISFPERKIADLRLLAHFHDIGKVGIPDRILFKPGPLTPEETSEMRRHCEIGHRIARSATDLVLIADWILKHHEWWNGTGYPLGLKEEEIPLECRILAIVDAYDAMTSDRPYRKALSEKDAREELLTCAGTQFDPKLVKKFIQALKKRDG